jgi:hypothetical protein
MGFVFWSHFAFNHSPNQKGRHKRPFVTHHQAAFAGLLNLGFFELDMLAHDGVVFAEGHFFRGIARVFLGYIEKASVSRAEQFDFDSGWLRHNPFLLFESKMMQGRPSAPVNARPMRVWAQ